MTTHRPQITFAEMRASDVREVLIYCRDDRCSHHIAISADYAVKLGGTPWGFGTSLLHRLHLGRMALPNGRSGRSTASAWIISSFSASPISAEFCDRSLDKDAPVSRLVSADREHQIVPLPRRTPSPLRPGLGSSVHSSARGAAAPTQAPARTTFNPGESVEDSPAQIMSWAAVKSFAIRASAPIARRRGVVLS
jgi:hypothetical protein